MFYASHIELSESAVETNVKFIREMLGDQVTFSSVVKGNAYGHSIEHYCPLAYKYGLRHFSVFSAQEAYRVLQAVPHEGLTVMIMGFIDLDQMRWAIENDVEFYIFEQQRVDAAIKAAEQIGKPAKVHVQLETGMNRLGFDIQESFELLKKVEKASAYIEIKGICTHLAGAESIANYKRIKNQQDRFKRISKKIKTYEHLNGLKWHMASSSASVRYPSTILDMARIGILQYGFFPTEEILVHYLSTQKKTESPLKRIISWKTKVMEIKEVEAGQFIGYGTSFFTNKPTVIAQIPVGYGDGYSRSLSNQGKVLINGVRVDVVGTVNMSMLAVEITNVEGVEKGDEVVLIGNQGDSEIGVSSFSDFSQQINYELLTRLPQDIPRLITK